MLNFEHFLQLVALVFLNALAFYFDGQYVPVAIGADLLLAGINAGSAMVASKNLVSP